MKCNSDTNEGAEQSVKEEKSLPGESNLQLRQKKFKQILEANVSDKFDPNEFLEVKENNETPSDTVTKQQYIKQELDNPNATLDNPHSYKSWNPWAVSSIFEFNFFCCPECGFSTRSDFKIESIQDFVNHASSKHPRVSFKERRMITVSFFQKLFWCLSDPQTLAQNPCSRISIFVRVHKPIRRQ